ncbi:mannosyltransferase [Fistulina hepatica ATCC 64428]|uniref:Alpha-1,3/1,6-mannosyltransferase ALG2 n=1 Tax=Fistulina hepatica ATCC 64428 TaxID=1128425 RepID=A0A0D7AEC5_9AGAR|nr:mannosyltransferase [Fistulina hepatica ATCC 64428]
MGSGRPLRVAFIHPDLGIGGAERLVVDAALGLQKAGHSVDIYTSHHNPDHCFEETRNGTLRVHNIVPPFPREIMGKLHIVFAHARQLHLTLTLLYTGVVAEYDVFVVDQLSTCVPFLRILGGKRVVFYGHFPDKLLAYGAFIEGVPQGRNVGLLRRLYRMPMDWFEEATTRQVDVLLANSKFSARQFKAFFPSIKQGAHVVYPGINGEAYDVPVDMSDPDVVAITSSKSTFLSMNRFERKKNAALAIEAFTRLLETTPTASDMRLVLGGGYDPRLNDNVSTLTDLVALARKHQLDYEIIWPESSPVSLDIPTSSASSPSLPSPKSSTHAISDPPLLFLLNFTAAQCTALLRSPHTRALLYTPTNEHFGIVPIEGMYCGLPLLACNSGGPTETIIDMGIGNSGTGWLRPPDADAWAAVLREIVALPSEQRAVLSVRAHARARDVFGMDAMTRQFEAALEEAVGTGPVASADTLKVVLLMLLGFVIAYAIGPLLW